MLTDHHRLHLDGKAHLTHTPCAGREVATREPDRQGNYTVIVMPTEQFRVLAEALANLEPDWFAAKPDANSMMIALGEFGDIWPASIFDGNDQARETYLLAKGLYQALKHAQAIPKHLRDFSEERAMADLLRTRFTSLAQQLQAADEAMLAHLAEPHVSHRIPELRIALAVHTPPDMDGIGAEEPLTA